MESGMIVYQTYTGLDKKKILFRLESRDIHAFQLINSYFLIYSYWDDKYTVVFI